MLNLQSLAVSYRNPRGAILFGIDLSAAPGDFICILGRNAAGKMIGAPGSGFAAARIRRFPTRPGTAFPKPTHSRPRARASW